MTVKPTVHKTGRLAALLLCFLVILGLTACKKEDQTPDSVYGVWKTTIQYTDYIRQLDEEFDGAGSAMNLAGLQLELILTLNSDNTYVLEADRASAEQLRTQLREPLTRAVRELLCRRYSQTEESLDAWLAERGVDPEERINQYLDRVAPAGPWQRLTGRFLYADGRLYLDETEKAWYALQTDTEQMRILSAEGGDPAGLARLLPLEFTWYSTSDANP